MKKLSNQYDVSFDPFHLPPTRAFTQEDREDGAPKTGLVLSMMHFVPASFKDSIEQRGLRVFKDGVCRYGCRNMSLLEYNRWKENDPTNAPATFEEYMNKHVIMANIDGFLTSAKGGAAPFNYKTNKKITNNNDKKEWKAAAVAFCRVQLQILASIAQLHGLPVVAIRLAGTGTAGERLKRLKSMVVNFDPALSSALSLPEKATLHPCLLLLQKWRLPPNTEEINTVAREYLRVLRVTGLYLSTDADVTRFRSIITVQFNENVRSFCFVFYILRTFNFKLTHNFFFFFFVYIFCTIFFLYFSGS